MGANLHYKLNSKAQIHFSGLRVWRQERQTRNAFQNDANINYLSEQLATIGEFGFSSREQIYGKADELKRSIDEKNEKVKSLTAEIPTLKSDIAQLHYLFSAVANTSKPDAMTQIKLAAARRSLPQFAQKGDTMSPNIGKQAAQEIADKYGIRTEGDISSLEKRLKLLPNYISSINDVCVLKINTNYILALPIDISLEICYYIENIIDKFRDYQ